MHVLVEQCDVRATSQALSPGKAPEHSASFNTSLGASV